MAQRKRKFDIQGGQGDQSQTGKPATGPREAPEISEDERQRFVGDAPIKTAVSAHEAPQRRERRYIRRTYSLLEEDDQRLETTRRRLAHHGEIRAKSDIVRAGLLALEDLDDQALYLLVSRVPQLKK